MADHPEIDELDINPAIVGAAGCQVADVHLTLTVDRPTRHAAAPARVSAPVSPAPTARPSDDADIVRRTQTIDLVRSVPAGVLVPLESSVLLTIVIITFDPSGWVKGLVAAAAGVGLLASPFVTAVARRLPHPAMVVAACISLFGAAGFAVAAIGPLALLVLGAIVGVAAISASIPLLTATYERNFSSRDRGRSVGRGMAVRVAVGAVVGLAMGEYLEAHPDDWWHLVLVGAVAMVALASSQSRFPSQPLAPVQGREHSLLPHFHLLGDDRQLRLTLIAWMFMGFGNLMLLPLRVEYLAGEQYGIEADAATIVLLTVTVPSVVRLLCMPVFGVLFDRLSFFSARIMVNLLFALYVAAFFSGTQRPRAVPRRGRLRRRLGRRRPDVVAVGHQVRAGRVVWPTTWACTRSSPVSGRCRRRSSASSSSSTCRSKRWRGWRPG